VKQPEAVIYLEKHLHQIQLLQVVLAIIFINHQEGPSVSTIIHLSPTKLTSCVFTVWNYNSRYYIHWQKSERCSEEKVRKAIP